MKSHKNHLLTFELDKNSGELEVHADKEGLKILRHKIEQLLSSTDTDHTHLISKDWGGDEITTTKQSDASILIESVKIFRWDRRSTYTDSQ